MKERLYRLMRCPYSKGTFAEGKETTWAQCTRWRHLWGRHDYEVPSG